MSVFTPFFRSRPFGHRHLHAGAIIKVGLITWLMPSLVGALIIAATAVGFEASNFDNPWTIMATVGGIMLLAPLYGIFLVPVGLLLGAWAMRFGLAGWGVALLASVCLPMAVGWSLSLGDPMAETWTAGLVFIPIVAVHAAAMWGATRWLCPQALLQPDQLAPGQTDTPP